MFLLGKTGWVTVDAPLVYFSCSQPHHSMFDFMGLSDSGVISSFSIDDLWNNTRKMLSPVPDQLELRIELLKVSST